MRKGVRFQSGRKEALEVELALSGPFGLAHDSAGIAAVVPRDSNACLTLDDFISLRRLGDRQEEWDHCNQRV